MDNNLILLITLRKTVETVEQGNDLYQLVKQWLADTPDVIITGRVTNQLEDEPES